MYILGVDPGEKSGAWALVDLRGDFVAVGDGEEALQIPAAIPLRDIRAAGLEKVGSQGRDAGRRWAAAQLMENYGYWRGLFDAWGLDKILIPPQEWQAFFGLIIQGRGFLNDSQRRTAKKHLVLGRARALFPHAKDKLARVADNGRATALLIAYYTAATTSGNQWIIKRSFA